MDMRKIKAVVFDFDGVFTDNRVYVFEDGKEAVVCHRSDGMGIGRLKKLGIEMLVLSTETNPVVTKRARKLKLPVIQSSEDKLSALRAWSEKKRISLASLAYLGNDINDLDCLKSVGLPVVVADAMPEVLPHAAIVLRKAGGKGAVRELCDMIFNAVGEGS
jgi:YrbI family 3-deoxy-D-manno-octulosonate 8-phosphate phosphatase